MTDEERIAMNALKQECLAAVECVLVHVQHLRQEIAALSKEHAQLRKLVHDAMENTVTED